MAVPSPLDQLDALGVNPEPAAVDRGYGYQTLAAGVPSSRRSKPQRRHRAGTDPSRLPGFRQLYRARGAVEREPGRLKHKLALAPLRVPSIDRMQPHVGL